MSNAGSSVSRIVGERAASALTATAALCCPFRPSACVLFCVVIASLAASACCACSSSCMADAMRRRMLSLLICDECVEADPSLRASLWAAAAAGVGLGSGWMAAAVGLAHSMGALLIRATAQKER